MSWGTIVKTKPNTEITRFDGMNLDLFPFVWESNYGVRIRLWGKTGSDLLAGCVDCTTCFTPEVLTTAPAPPSHVPAFMSKAGESSRFLYHLVWFYTLVEFPENKGWAVWAKTYTLIIYQFIQKSHSLAVVGEYTTPFHSYKQQISFYKFPCSFLNSWISFHLWNPAYTLGRSQAGSL